MVFSSFAKLTHPVWAGKGLRLPAQETLGQSLARPKRDDCAKPFDKALKLHFGNLFAFGKDERVGSETLDQCAKNVPTQLNCEVLRDYRPARNANESAQERIDRN